MKYRKKAVEIEARQLNLANIDQVAKWWLNAKGFTGEAGACHAAMDKIRKQEARIAELETELETTKSLLPQKLDEAPYRPPFISDWWSIAVLERRKRRNVDKELRAHIMELEERIDAFEMDAGHAAARIAELEAALDEILNYIGGANNALEDEYVMERARAALEKKDD
jgi:uncharacterized coiled-coil protein SlyX